MASERLSEKVALQRNKNMKKIKKNSFKKSIFGIVTLLIAPHVLAEETIIQQEKLSFERCLKVITTSQDKLSIAPEVEDVSDQKRIAVFTLVDGTLTITCDGIEGNVTVSTNTELIDFRNIIQRNFSSCLLLKDVDQDPRTLIIFNLLYGANELCKGSSFNFDAIAWQTMSFNL